MTRIPFKQIQSIAQKFGLEALAFTSIQNANSQKDYLKFWQEQGYAASLEYMQRPSDLFCEPTQIFPELKSIIVFTINYSSKIRPELQPGFGKVARYAWGKDYHKVIKKRLKGLVEGLKKELEINFNYRYFADAVPLLERFYAKDSGLGFIGKNTMLIRPKQGSFCFLSELLSDIEISDTPLPQVDYGCGSCTRCIANCPTKAIIKPYLLDANRCISYLTIEKRGLLNPWEQDALGEWIFGCDICQEVCPFNYATMKLNRNNCWEDFSDIIAKDGQLSLAEILAIKDDQEFVKRFAGSPIMRTKRQGLIRNACVVSANLNLKELRPLIEKLALKEQDLVIKIQAEQTLERF